MEGREMVQQKEKDAKGERRRGRKIGGDREREEVQVFPLIAGTAMSHPSYVCRCAGRQMNNDEFQGQRSNFHPQREVTHWGQ